MGNLATMYSDSQLSKDEMYELVGGIIITIGTVTLVLTAKGIALGVAAVTAAYQAGKAIGNGLAYIKN